MNNLYFLNNNLFSENFLLQEFVNFPDFKLEIDNIFNEIKELYNPNYFSNLNEEQLIEAFIKKVLEKLGWEFLTQEIQIIQGKQQKPDFSLFTVKEEKENYIFNKEPERISLICEAKSFNTRLDNKKIKDNPHFQIVEYMSRLNKRYGFLTNGRYWRFYDKEKFSSDKVFYEIDLEEIFNRNDIEAFKYFYHIFKRDNFIKKDNKELIEEINIKNEEVKQKVEEDLRNIIYGLEGNNSIFEVIGQAIYKKYSNEDLEIIYENSLYLLFRLLFIAYFEDKFFEILKKHLYYNELSLNKILDKVKYLKYEYELEFNLYRELKQLFKILDNGDYDIDIPLFNGGLFDLNKAKLLEGYKIINNKDLKNILETIFYYKGYRRDFKTLSVTNLGSIYEGLLAFRFYKAEEEIFYLEYEKYEKNEKKIISEFVDIYDYQRLNKEKNIKILNIQKYEENQIYLKTISNSRKTTASYYTPKPLVDFMVKEAIDKALEKYNPLEIKIIDNACGSGNFLVNSLNYLTSKVLENIEKYQDIKNLIKEEKEKINSNLSNFNFKYEVDEFSVLKRIILKNTIYGVDINHFAIEITKLALWIDSFIFGTPLSFIEHHIKTGNSLIGTTIEEFKDFWSNKNKGGFNFYDDLLNKFNLLSEYFHKISDLKDTTNEEIQSSKKIYKQIEPKLNELNKMLNILTYFKFLKIEKDVKKINEIDFNTNIHDFINNHEISQYIDFYSKKYLFFNYEIEFPEVFARKDKGFNIIIGNPPWEKTKFDDRDFFSQYKTNYRTLTNTQKEEFKINTLSKEYINKKYEYEKDFVEKSNEYYKENYPYNRGSGDGNLFRFFLEKNLSLLSKNGNITYLVPSAIMLEEGSTNLRKYIFENFDLSFFYSFENRRKLFKDVSSDYEFSILQINKNKKTENIKVKFMITNPNDLYNNNFIDYSIENVELLSPEYFSLQRIQNNNDFNLIKYFYKKYKKLTTDYLDFRKELDMTNDKDLFYEKYQEGMVPLYEGKMIFQYNPKFSKPQYFIKINEAEKRLKSKEIHRLCQDIAISQNDLKNKLQNNSLDNFISYEYNYYRLSFRSIANNNMEKSLISSLLPKNIFAGNSLFISVSKKYIFKEDKIHLKYTDIELLLFIMGIFNSLIVNYIIRLMTKFNINKTYIYRLPIPQPSKEEIYNNEIYKKLMFNSLKLTLYYDYDEFEELANKFNIGKKDIPKTEKQVDLLKIENDILVSKLYNLSLEDLKHICSYFKVLSKNKPEYISVLLDSFSKSF